MPPLPRFEQRLSTSWARARPDALAQALRPLSWMYGGLAALQRASYTLGLRHAQQLPVPVLVVGNLVAGGAGKTPVVLHLVQALRQRGWRPGVVARGHGAQAAGGGGALLVSRNTPAALVGDEPLLLHLRCKVPVAVARHRTRAAQALLRQHPGLNLIVADDGLQHHALARNAQVIVFDARGVGNGLLLPAGPLRQAFTPNPPARSVVLYSAGAPSTPWPGFLAQRRLVGAVALTDWWQGAAAQMDTLTSLRGRPLLAAAGLAQPQGFFDMLRAQGLTIQPLPLPDHHPFTTLPWPFGSADVIVTEKDAVKLTPDRCGPTRVWVATLDCEPEPAFDAAVQALLPPPAP